MIPASQAQATRALKPLFSAFPVDKGTGAAASYLIAVEGAPIAAIEMAVLRFVRGDVEGADDRYLPTPAQVGKLVRHCTRLVSPVEKPKLLNPPIEERDESPEACAARRAAVERIISDRFPQAQVDPIAQPPITDLTEWSRSVKRESETGNYKLSPEALATLDPDHRLGRQAERNQGD